MTGKDHFSTYREASAYLKGRLEESGIPPPTVGIICGSGLSGLSSALTNNNNNNNNSASSLSVSYSHIPGFPDVTVVGHSGEVVFGMLQNVPTICFRGRFHSYEGHDMNTVVLPVRVMRLLGVKLLLVTNAAGGINASYQVGDIVSITDHFALPMLAGKNPLIGPNDDALGPRFPPTSNMYDPFLQQTCWNAASTLHFTDFLRQNGTYCFVSGPMYESKAECRFLRTVGGDTVGMSTVPEMLAAHHCGMKVLCLSLVTNKVVIDGDEGPPASHGEVIDSVNKRSQQIQDLVSEIVKQLNETNYLEQIVLNDIHDDKPTSSNNNKFVACPYHIIKRTPIQYMIMGATILSIGAFLSKRT